MKSGNAIPIQETTNGTPMTQVSEVSVIQENLPPSVAISLACCLSLLGINFSFSIRETASRLWDSAYGQLLGQLSENASRQFMIYAFFLTCPISVMIFKKLNFGGTNSD